MVSCMNSTIVAPFAGQNGFSGVNKSKSRKNPSLLLMLNPPVWAAVHIKNTIDDRFTKAQKKKIYGTAAVVGALLLAVTAVGRNPVKAAQTLSGSTMKTKPYKLGEELLNEVLKKRGSEYSVNLEDFKSFFKEGDKFDFEKAIDTLDDFIQKNREIIPENVANAFKGIQNRTKQLILDRKEGFLTMEGISKERTEQFLKSNADDMDILSEFFQKKSLNPNGDNTLSVLKILEDNFKIKDISVNSDIVNLHRKINAFEICPDDILPKDNVYYHGTGETGKIFKKGITPFNSNQLNKTGIMAVARECGAGIYLTPDEQVAQTFAGVAGPKGKLLSYKANDMRVGITSQESMINLYNTINSFLNERTAEHIPQSENPFAIVFDIMQTSRQHSAAKEILLRKIMLNNGYDAIYTTKGINSLKDTDITRHMFDINSKLGRPEAQFVVYTPEKLELLPRTLKQRIFDIKDRSVRLGNFILNDIKSSFEIYKDMFNIVKK